MEVLDPYVSALGVRLEVSVVRAGHRTRLMGDSVAGAATAPRADSLRNRLRLARYTIIPGNERLCGISGKADGKDPAQRN